MNIWVWLKDAIFGVGVASLLLTPLAAWYYLLPVSPYEDVVLISTSNSEEGVLHVVATFVKNEECSFVDLGVFGNSLGEWDRLDWFDLDEPQGDRLAGEQTLRIGVQVDGQYDPIEIRTRHDCGGTKTDRVFLTLNQENL